MIHTIENDYLRVSVDDHGAELCSIFDKVHNREVIWQADPATGSIINWCLSSGDFRKP